MSDLQRQFRYDDEPYVDAVLGVGLDPAPGAVAAPLSEYLKEKGISAEVIDPRSADPVELVKSITGGFGADLVIESAGVDASLASALDLPRNNGRISFVGINIGRVIPVELGKIQIRGLQIKGMVGSPYVWERAIAFLANSGKDISPIVTNEFALDQVEDAFALASKRSECIKVMVFNE